MYEDPEMTSETTFNNNFWDSQDQGLKVVNQKVKDSTTTLVELLDYYGQRLIIEKEYNKKLEKLNSASNFGSREIGGLKVSLDKLQSGNLNIVDNNDKFMKNLQVINYNSLKEFYNYYKRKSSKILSSINKLHQKKLFLAQQLNEAKTKFQTSCGNYKRNRLSTQTTWGKELERNEQKSARLIQEVNQDRKNYQLALATYQEINDIFIRDWTIALNDIYKLEIEKTQTLKVNCFHFCNNIASLCVDNDQSADSIRSIFAKINPNQDLQSFSDIYGTGNKIYKAPLFMDYMEGVDEDSHHAQYSLANFPLPDSSSIVTRSYSYKNATQNVFENPPSSKNSPTKPLNFGYNNSPTRQTIGSTHSPTKSVDISSGINQTNEPKYNTTEETKLLPYSVNSTPSPKKLTRKIPEDIKSNVSNNTEVFDETKKFGDSGSSSKYSDDTNYSSNSGRHWNSPRKSERQINEVQEKINRQTKELPTIKNTIPVLNPKVDIQKDFSIDFIAKALEDLNSGGDGDISRFRKSVRQQQQQQLQEHQQQHHYKQQHQRASPSRDLGIFQTPQKHQQRSQHPYHETQNQQRPSQTYQPLPKSDFINDKHEVATRYSSRPKSMVLDSSQTPFQEQAHRRRSMVDIEDTSVIRQKRTLSKSPTKSYTDLHSIIKRNRLTPVSNQPYVGKATARYTYKPQHEGELYIKKNWNMYVIHRQEDNWYICELASNCNDCEGMVGLVPGNYLVEGDNIF